MPSLFGKARGARMVYHKIDQQCSESEFSLSDDEQVLFSKQGEIELNLYPDTRVQRPDRNIAPIKRYLAICAAVLVIVVSVTAVAIVYSRIHSSKTSKPSVATKPDIQNDGSNKDSNKDDHHPGHDMELDQSKEGWRKTFKEYFGEGTVRLLDMDGDGLDDILISASQLTDSDINVDHDFSIFANMHKYCESREENGSYPCLASLIALRGLDGSELWRMPIRSDAFELNCEEFDINQDGKMDCIGAGRMATVVAFDPYSGKTLWTCENDTFLKADWNTYNAAALPDLDNDGVPEVLVANGGNVSKGPKDHNRDPGRLVLLSGKTGVPMGTRYLDMPDSKETYMSPVVYTPHAGSATYILFGSGGETVPGDLMGISIGDFCRYILGPDAKACPEDGHNVFKNQVTHDENGIFLIYRGKEKGVMVPPVIADVNADGTLDILMTSFEGVMKLYNGLDLTELWTAEFQGCETYGTPAPGYFDDDEFLDFMVHWNFGIWMEYSSVNSSVISGKDGSTLWTLGSTYRQMTSSLSIQTNLKHQDMFLFKVQGRESKYHFSGGKVIRPGNTTDRQRRHEDASLDDDIDSMSPEQLMEKMRKQHLSCDDDLSSFFGEVFLLDRSMLQSPVRLLTIPTNKHHYDVLSVKTKQSDHQGGDGEDHMPHPVEGGTSEDRIGSHAGRHREGRSDEDMFHMCAVENPDSMGFGAIGNLDGDEYLDFVYINEVTSLVFHEDFSVSEGLADYTIQKINMEMNLLDGVFKHVPVSAETKMTESKPTDVLGNKRKTFLPLSEQKWTQYMGSKGTNTYQ